MKIISNADVKKLLSKTNYIKLFAPNTYRSVLGKGWYDCIEADAHDFLKRNNVIDTTTYGADKGNAFSKENQLDVCIKNNIPVIIYIRTIKKVGTYGETERINKFITLQWLDHDKYQFIDGKVSYTEYEQNQISIQSVMAGI